MTGRVGHTVSVSGEVERHLRYPQRQLSDERHGRGGACGRGKVEARLEWYLVVYVNKPVLGFSRSWDLTSWAAQCAWAVWGWVAERVARPQFPWMS